MQLRTQRAGKPGHAPGNIAIAAQHARPGRQSRRRSVAFPGAFKPESEIHEQFIAYWIAGVKAR
jgi:hypothetical protein